MIAEIAKRTCSWAARRRLVLIVLAAVLIGSAFVTWRDRLHDRRRAVPVKSDTPVAASLFRTAPADRTEVNASPEIDHKARHFRSIMEHDAEPVDGTWSGQATTELTNALHEIGVKGGFRVAQVDCRSKSCVATIEWPNYAAASAAWGEILVHQYRLPCRTSVYLEDPIDVTPPYRTAVVYECPRDGAKPNGRITLREEK